MSIISYPFESQNIGTDAAPVYDRAITAEDERYFNKLRYTNGVFAVPANALQVRAPNGNLTVTVAPGGCHVEGALLYNTEDYAITLTSHATLPKIYRIVARFDTSLSVRAIQIVAKEGASADVPVVPELIQEPNYYEIALADIRVPAGAAGITDSSITDQRLNGELCGLVVPAIPTPIDFSGLYDQYQASLDEYLAIVEAAIDETLAAQLRAEIQAVAVEPLTDDEIDAICV